MEEQKIVRTMCIKAFLLLLVGLITIFSNERSYDMADGTARLGHGARVVLGWDDTCFSLLLAFSYYRLED